MRGGGEEGVGGGVVGALQRTEPGLSLYCMEQSVTYRVARAMGQPVVREFYADRDYDATGSIVFTRRTGRLDPRTVADKVVRACAEGRVRTVQGGDIAIGFDSVCIHSDTPGALEILQALRQALADNGIRGAALPAVLQAAGAGDQGGPARPKQPLPEHPPCRRSKSCPRCPESSTARPRRTRHPTSPKAASCASAMCSGGSERWSTSAR